MRGVGGGAKAWYKGWLVRVIGHGVSMIGAKARYAHDGEQHPLRQAHVDVAVLPQHA